MVIQSRLAAPAVLLLGSLAMAQAVSQTGTPAQTIDETHELWLMTTMNPDNCTGTAIGKLVFKPQDEAPYINIPMIVADTYEIEVKIQKPSDEVLVWKGKWTWEDEERCGKNTCKKEREHLVNRTSSFTIGETLKIRLFDDEKEVMEIKKNDVNKYNGIAIKSKMVEIKAPPFQFAPPQNPQPDPRAELQPPGLCAQILKPRVHVADFHIRIVRRLR